MINKLLFDVTNVNKNKRLNRCYTTSYGLTKLW